MHVEHQQKMEKSTAGIVAAAVRGVTWKSKPQPCHYCWGQKGLAINLLSSPSFSV
jgi:hypothetical protein